jgi:hypothetical protein
MGYDRAYLARSQQNMIQINHFNKKALLFAGAVLSALIPEKSMFVISPIMLAKHDQMRFFFKVKFG